MNPIELKDAARQPRNVVSVGTFDGVHLGHRELIRKIVELARIEGAMSTIVTFDPHPREILNPGDSRIKRLTTMDERAAELAALGVDQLVLIPFDRDFSLMDSATFIREVVWKQIGVSHFVIGYDHQFGRDRKGTVDTVRSAGQELGFLTTVFPRQDKGDSAVSSTRIRSLLQNGDVEAAGELLGRPYCLTGSVVRGDGRGRTIGFPTANLRITDPRKLIPAYGVYAVRVVIGDETHPGVVNLGVRPTFDHSLPTVEAHLLDYAGNLYGCELQIRFVKRLRDERRFGSADELKEQIARDCAEAVRALET